MIALLVTEVLPANSARPLVVAGWSMGGKAAFAVTRELEQRGRTVTCFVSIAATPPLPRSDPAPNPSETLTNDGLWNLDTIGPYGGSKREDRWLDELAQIGHAEGHPVMTDDTFRSHCRSNVPPGLNGPELDTPFSGGVGMDVATAMRDAGTFSGRNYPICVSIVPTAVLDYRHALTDEATWGHITLRSVITNYVPKIPAIESLPNAQWMRLRERITDSPRRLARSIDGGHLFFVGSNGARRTVDHLYDLVNEATELRQFLRQFATDSTAPSAGG